MHRPRAFSLSLRANVQHCCVQGPFHKKYTSDIANVQQIYPGTTISKMSLFFFDNLKGLISLNKTGTAIKFQNPLYLGLEQGIFI